LIHVTNWNILQNSYWDSWRETKIWRLHCHVSLITAVVDITWSGWNVQWRQQRRRRVRQRRWLPFCHWDLRSPRLWPSNQNRNRATQRYSELSYRVTWMATAGPGPKAGRSGFVEVRSWQGKKAVVLFQLQFLVQFGSRGDRLVPSVR